RFRVIAAAPRQPLAERHETPDFSQRFCDVFRLNQVWIDVEGRRRVSVRWVEEIRADEVCEGCERTRDIGRRGGLGGDTNRVIVAEGARLDEKKVACLQNALTNRRGEAPRQD